jgi:hypothetical protein
MVTNKSRAINAGAQVAAPTKSPNTAGIGPAVFGLFFTSPKLQFSAPPWHNSLMKTTTPTSFMDLVAAASRSLPMLLRKTQDTQDDQSISMSDWLMVHKVQKHLLVGNQRKAAQYVAMRLEEDPAPLSTWAADQMRKTPLKASKTQVAYTNHEGVQRAFGFVRATA